MNLNLYKEFKLSELFSKILNDILDFIYPENITCVLCDNPIRKDNTYSICKSCFDELNFILDGCLTCGKNIINYSLEENDIKNCNFCKDKKFYFDRAISCIEYTDLSKKFIFKLKYNDKTYLSKIIANIMKEKLCVENIKVDYILCVPIHKKRLKERGFNQSQKISFYLSKYLDIPFLDILKRIKKTKKLYKLNKNERQNELNNVFKIDDKNNLLKNKDVLVVDDIFTTGSTVNEISKVLRKYGVNKIYIVTLITKHL